MTATNNAAQPSNLAAWQARAVHDVVLPSGQTVRMRIPGVGTILEHGDLPDDLLETALAEITHAGGAAGKLADDAPGLDGDQLRQRVREFAAFQRHLVAAALVEPALTYDQVTDAVAAGSLPEDDLAWVAEIVLRIRSTDARGVRIGVEPLDRWAMFREAHGCDDSQCEGCQKLVELFSTADVGAV